jgi:hypothetical protein
MHLRLQLVHEQHLRAVLDLKEVFLHVDQDELRMIFEDRRAVHR